LNGLGGGEDGEGEGGGREGWRGYLLAAATFPLPKTSPTRYENAVAAVHFV